MSSRLLSALAAAFLLAASAPALAQQATPPAAAPQAEAESLDDAAIEVAGEAFGARMETMQQEMDAALTAAGGDKTKAKGELDAIQARYQPEADAFADTLSAFLRAKLATMPEEQQAQMQAGLAQLDPVIRGIPAQVRALVENPEAEADPAASTSN